MSEWFDKFKNKKPAVCPICGKEYFPAPEHVWKIGNWDGITGERYILVCSYSCMRVWEKEQIANDKKKQRARHKKEG